MLFGITVAVPTVFIKSSGLLYAKVAKGVLAGRFTKGSPLWTKRKLRPSLPSWLVVLLANARFPTAGAP
jgi:hypothetical protein